MEALFIDFVNSRWHAGRDGKIDPLTDLVWLNELAERWRLAPLARLTDAEVRGLASLRTLLGEALEALAEGQAPSPATTQQLNSCLALEPLRYELQPSDDGFRAVLRPIGSTSSSDTDDTSRATSELAPEIVRSFAEFIAAHDPHRLRICGNPDCRWVFYDETRNASRRWCGPTCSSLIKVRRYRARHR